MIVATYTAKDYRQEDVEARYVRVDARGQWFWCEVAGNRRWDCRQGTCDEADVPLDIAEKARRLSDQWPAYVGWPIPNCRFGQWT